MWPANTSFLLRSELSQTVRAVVTVAHSRKSEGTQPCLAIRRETVNAWERRAPLAPIHVKKLVEKGVKVLIQPSNRRAYPIQEYTAAGATPREDLSEASVIISVKTVTIDELLPNKTYAFFSHTIKAQRENMPLLDKILSQNVQLIDYEKMVDEKGKRLVMFGKWAGYAGFCDILHGLGLRLLALGHHTPFLHIGLAHNYRDSHMAVNSLRDCGYEIALGYMPQSIGPLTFVFTGSGNVSQGAQELFQNLPHEYVDAKTLPKVAKRGSLNKVYGCVVSRRDHYVRKEGGKFDGYELEEFPERYKSNFAQTIAPYASVIINGIYWSASSPRLITIPDAKNLLTPTAKHAPDVAGEPTLPHRLLALSDISADPGGSIEFNAECTTIDKPFCIYDADQHKTTDSFASPSGVLVCSIDNMPAQMPLEATEYFGNLLLPYIQDIINCKATKNFEEIETSQIVKNAIITNNGRLTPNFEYITDLRKQQAVSSQKAAPTTAGDEKKVLLLGAGFVSGPVVKYFAGERNINVTVASDSQWDLEKLSKMESTFQPVILDVLAEPEKLEQLIEQHNVVISLLPYGLHAHVAKLCIKRRTHMVTSSYLSPEMYSLHDDAKNAGITIMNEVGLDPGIDHMLAMECIDNAKEQGGRITSFISWCGGLPAPENSDNPLRYKFSWSPKGVLMALLNPAKYLLERETIEIPPGGLLNAELDVNFMPGFNLVGYPNRDSTIYGKIYGIENEVESLLRGTLRYKGFLEALRGLYDLGLLNMHSIPSLDPTKGPDISWKELVAQVMNKKMDIFPDSLRNLAAERFGPEREQEFQALNELGLFSDDIMVERCDTPLDTLAAHLSKVAAYGPDERDLVILLHDITIKYPDGKMEEHFIELVEYGQPEGFSAMSKTVGYTAAVVAKMIVTGEIQKTGMVLPMSKDVYRPTLQRLNELGIKIRKHVKEL